MLMDSEKHLESPSALQYFIAEKNAVLIVSWVGEFAHGTAEVIDKCRDEVVKSGAKWVIFNLRDLKPSMDRITVPVFARLQKGIREKPAVLRLTSMHPDLRGFLQEQGVLRPEELSNNLAEALQGIAQMKAA
jgi:anti-anti-sigma regulatory factor